MWDCVGSTSDFSEDEPSAVTVAGKPIAIYLIDGKYYATHALCSHGLAYLSDGYLDGEEIECPLHQGRFHVPTGRALCSPLTEDIATYETKIEDGRLFVRTASE